MSPIGHTLTGLAIGYAALPVDLPRRQKLLPLGLFALLANAPDWPLPGLGHERYDISHSIFTNLLAIGCVLLLLEWVWPRRLALKYKFAGAAAWLSHLLLDTFYSHRKGLAMFWPVSDARVNLAFPFFHRGDLSNVWSHHNLQVALVEGVFYGSILLLVMVGKRFTSRTPKVLRPRADEG